MWLRVRRTLLSWWIWALIAIAATITDHWWWAGSTGLWAFVCFLLTPSERAPQFGLDHEFGVDDPRFLPTISGVTGAAGAAEVVSAFYVGSDVVPSLIRIGCLA